MVSTLIHQRMAELYLLRIHHLCEEQALLHRSREGIFCGFIQVVVRVRPLNQRELEAGAEAAVFVDRDDPRTVQAPPFLLCYACFVGSHDYGFLVGHPLHSK